MSEDKLTVQTAESTICLDVAAFSLTAKADKSSGRQQQLFNTLSRSSVSSTLTWHSAIERQAPAALEQLQRQWSIPPLFGPHSWPPGTSAVALPLSAIPLLKRQGIEPEAVTRTAGPSKCTGHGLAELEWGRCVPRALHGASSRRLRSFMAGRLCAEAALHRLVSSATGIPGFCISTGIPEGIDMGPQGEPVWPEVGGHCLTGSITHSERWAAAVVCPKAVIQSIGIDCEELMDGQSHDAALQVCFTKWELGRYPDLAPDATLATAMYAAKEAFYKAIWPYVRRFVDFTEVEVLEMDRPSGTLHLQSKSQDVAVLLRQRWLHRFTLCGGTVHAVSALFSTDG